MLLTAARHGETAYNIQQRYAGCTDIPLNDTGLVQADALAQRLRAESFDLIAASSLLRARQTADAVARFHPHLSVQIYPEFRERNMGVYEGKTAEEARTLYPAQYQRQCTRTLNDAPDGGETILDVQTRVHQGLVRLWSACPQGHVLLICHGFVLRALHQQLTHGEWADIHLLRFENCTPVQYNVSAPDHGEVVTIA